MKASYLCEAPLFIMLTFDNMIRNDIKCKFLIHEQSKN